MQITGWQFCGYNGVDCKKGGSDIKGEYVELAILVKAPKDKEPETQAVGDKEKGKAMRLDDLVMTLPYAVSINNSMRNFRAESEMFLNFGSYF